MEDKEQVQQDTRFVGTGQVWNPSTEKADIIFPKGVWDDRYFHPGVLKTNDPEVIDRLRSLGFKEVDENGIEVKRQNNG
jgi:hypothetical protein